tara:strand:- start:1501 stop:3840 length:2340 start_codon:yes stop_codon:yes gene_type:complete
MKNKIKFFILSIFIAQVFAVGEAGAVFLLINPGSRAAGAGEAQVAKANDAYASYYNPAGLGFLRGQEVVMQHVNWLPNLTSDIFYDFLAYRKSVSGLGTFGGHIIFLNLGTQQGMDEWNNYTGEFKSYMAAINFSYGTQISENKSVGMNFKVFHQKLSDKAQAGETGDPFSTDFGFDVGYLQKFGKRNQHQFGFSIQNVGPPIDFIDAQQADPAPTNMRLGLYTELFKTDVYKLNLLFDANKLLVASYPTMDWNGDGIISGSKEEAHSDPWYKGVFTAWLDDWYYGGDYDLCESPCGQASNLDDDIHYAYGSERDGRIGGYFALPGYNYVNNDGLYEYYDYLYSQILKDADNNSVSFFNPNNGKLHNDSQNFIDCDSEFGICEDDNGWDPNVMGNGIWDLGEIANPDGNLAGQSDTFSYIDHEDFFELDPDDDSFAAGVPNYQLPFYYPSKTKIYDLSIDGSSSSMNSHLNSLDFLIKKYPELIVKDKIEVLYDQVAYIPNYEGFCDQLYTPAGGYFYADGEPLSLSADGDAYGYSMCHSLDPDISNEVQSYYKYNVIGDYNNPKWVKYENPEFNIDRLTYLDLPHDGMGEFDKFHLDCPEGDDSCVVYIAGMPCFYADDPNGENQPCDETDIITQNNLDNYIDIGGRLYYDINLDDIDTFEDIYGPGLYESFGEKSFKDPRYGDYNAQGNLEKGSGKQREFKDELEEMIYNFGMEFSYTESFVMRVGFIYDLEGDIKNPTFGAGINISDKYGFDFGYTAGDKGHPRENTMFFSLSLGL